MANVQLLDANDRSTLSKHVCTFLLKLHRNYMDLEAGDKSRCRIDLLACSIEDQRLRSIITKSIVALFDGKVCVPNGR